MARNGGTHLSYGRIEVYPNWIGGTCMLRVFVLLLILVPALEIWGFITVGKLIGGFNTFLLIILTGILGAYLMKHQGLQAVQEVSRRMSYGEPPGPAILDGFSILIGGVMLLAPGFFTDIIGLLLLLPPTRSIFKYFLLKWIMKKIRSGSVYINGRRF